MEFFSSISKILSSDLFEDKIEIKKQLENFEPNRLNSEIDDECFKTPVNKKVQSNKSRSMGSVTPSTDPSKLVSPISQEKRQLKKLLNAKDKSLLLLHTELDILKESYNELLNANKMAKEEVDEKDFLISLLEQKISELEDKISEDTLEHNEELSDIHRKNKSSIHKLNKEKKEYEVRANNMINELTQQMSQLQTMAMGRIENLEKELLESRHKYEELNSFNLRLQTELEAHKSMISQYERNTVKEIDELEDQFKSDYSYEDEDGSDTDTGSTDTCEQEEK